MKIKVKIPFVYRIPLIYIFLGAMWILFSDRLMVKIWQDAHMRNLVSIYKGWFFVLVTGGLLYLLIKKEIGKRNELYNNLLLANKKAMEADRLKTAFLSNLSHYIRTPMNSILGFVDLLRSRNMDEEKRMQFLQIVDDRSHLLLHTINNIVEISKLQEGQMTVNNHRFLLSELMRGVFFSFEQDSVKLEKNINFYFTIPPADAENWLVADYGKIQDILTNLVSNALNFTEAGEVELGYTIEDSAVIFYVRDTGKGISSEKREKLFTSYFEGDPEHFDKSEGSGVGLYLSARLAILLGGRLWLEYTGNSGSKFCLRVPLQND
ncbi:MAG: HAMP domain-containing sensor histidine kinase [Bacteroidota bacterium]|nr:HAMP domain-containing sensor histidine kinase [Bacteroidota bacterium]